MGQRIDLPTLSGVADYRQITPTDIAQFIRLDQCERYLRLRLHTRAMGTGFMKAYGVVPQSIPPLLTRSGERFEDRIEQAVAAHVRTLNLAQESAGAADRDEDNARLITETRALSSGETVVLFQPRLRAEVDGWRMRGDVDILRLARDGGGGLHVLIADMKSSTASRVEHRLQVAFYHEMLAALYARAAFDSPVATFLDREIRELKDYPMVCQSLQAVAAYLRFDWNVPAPYRAIVRVRLFDFWGKLDGPEGMVASPWYTARARFNSQIPLEYADAAWGELAEPAVGAHDEFASYRDATPDLLVSFHRRRLEALEHITRAFKGNAQTEKRVFDLPDLTAFAEKAATLAAALDEFVTIERHVTLADWKAKRLAPPERRLLAGDTLLVRYVEADQEPDVAVRNRENLGRARLDEEYRAAYKAVHPDATQVRLPKEQREKAAWSQDRRGDLRSFPALEEPPAAHLHRALVGRRACRTARDRVGQCAWHAIAPRRAGWRMRRHSRGLIGGRLPSVPPEMEESSRAPPSETMLQRRFGVRNGLDSAVCAGPIIDVYALRRYMRYASAVQGRVSLGRDALLRAAGSPLSKANAVSQSMLCTTLDWRPLSRLVCA